MKISLCIVHAGVIRRAGTHPCPNAAGGATAAANPAANIVKARFTIPSSYQVSEKPGTGYNKTDKFSAALT
jgi:hypothetical protein